MRGTIISSSTETRVRRTMNANAVALSPPAISSTTPRSQVISETTHQLFLRHEGGTLGHTGHSGEDHRGSDDDMSSLREWSILEEIFFDDFSTNVILQWDYTLASRDSMIQGRTGCRHICPETKSGDIDHQVIRCEIVEDVPLLVSFLQDSEKES